MSIASQQKQPASDKACQLDIRKDTVPEMNFAARHVPHYGMTRHSQTSKGYLPRRGYHSAGCASQRRPYVNEVWGEYELPSTVQDK